MPIRMDRRPTLASWPKRIYEWSELPAFFWPALERWKEQGMPPGNVTYIPKVNQYSESAEYVTAWLGEEVMLLTRRGNDVEKLTLRRETIGAVTYRVELLHCTVTVTLTSGSQVSFSYNKAKEDQLMPVLNLLLGNPPDYRPAAEHPEREPFERLLQENYAMYHTAQLCYRFGPDIRDCLWFQGRQYGWFQRRRQKPEWFLASMDRGLVALSTDFYGTGAVYLSGENLSSLTVEEADFPLPGPRRRKALVLRGRCGTLLCAPLLSEQEREAEGFTDRLKGASARH